MKSNKYQMDRGTVANLISLATKIEKTECDAALALRRLARRIGEGTNGHSKKNGGSNGRAAGLKLQGRYMGLTRLMGPRKKARYRKIRAASGYVAAIRAIEKDKRA